MSKPIVAIVGRPNVGKSTLFNKIIGERRSIVEDTPGVTRDRIYADAEWGEHRFLLVDTGGIEPKSDDTILRQMRRQATLAIETADVIVFLCDVKSGLVADDRDIAVMLNKSGKTVIPVVNKVDKVGELPYEFYEFYELGFDRDPIPLSSLHGTGSGDLLDAIVEACDFTEEEKTDDGIIRVAVIGKPNAGKSSIINKMCGEERLIVSDIAGTTRDAVDTRVENAYGVFNFIDTAGIRRQAKVEDRIEKFSVLRAKAAVERADVCLLMIDAADGVTEQDERIAGIAHEAGKATIILVNKWDSVEKDNSTVNNHYSGTMGVAYEGALKYIPSIAFSSCDYDPQADLMALRPFVHQVVEKVLAEGLPKGTCLNVNFPKGSEFRGIKVCRMTYGRWTNEVVDCQHPRGGKYYWMVGHFHNDEPEAVDTDQWALNHGYVAVTPSTIDVTDYELMRKLKF